MKRLAIIGTGIAGMGAAHHLRQRFDLTLYERNSYVGGHTNTVTVTEEGKEIPIDTGFMVFNYETYPTLVRLFEELRVPVRKTSMSFSVQHLPSGLEYAGSSLNHLFAQRRNLLSPRYLRMLIDIDRFNRHATEALDDPRFADCTLEEYVARKGFGRDLLERYLVPMSSAVWSTPSDRMLRFPARVLIRFFHNHGFLGLMTQHQWYTVAGGSREYRERLIEPFRGRIRVASPVVRVRRTGGGAEVVTRDGASEHYDAVILASHADESLSMLEQPTDDERRLLGVFQYQRNRATLHTDPSVMPKTALAWASWNHRVRSGPDGSPVASTIYWMNSLQQVSERRNYFISINDPEAVDPSRVLWETDYTHPVFTVETAKAQEELPLLNAAGPVYFCGSYFRYGFHEDAYLSAVTLADRIAGTETA